jgi:hypothetical protein
MPRLIQPSWRRAHLIRCSAQDDDDGGASNIDEENDPDGRSKSRLPIVANEIIPIVVTNDAGCGSVVTRSASV